MNIIKKIEKGLKPCHISPRKRNKPEVAMALVKKHRENLEFLNEKNRDDYDIVYAAVSSNGFALEFASSRLKKNKDIVTAALCSTLLASQFEFADDTLKRDKEYILFLLKEKHKNIYPYIDNSLKSDDEIVYYVLCNWPRSVDVEYIPESIYNNRDRIINIMHTSKSSGVLYSIPSSSYKNDKELVLTGIIHDARSSGYPIWMDEVSDEIYEDDEVICYVYKYLPDYAENSYRFIAMRKKRELLAMSSDSRNIIEQNNKTSQILSEIAEIKGTLNTIQLQLSSIQQENPQRRREDSNN